MQGFPCNRTGCPRSPCPTSHPPATIPGLSVRTTVTLQYTRNTGAHRAASMVPRLQQPTQHTTPPPDKQQCPGWGLEVDTKIRWEREAATQALLVYTLPNKGHSAWARQGVQQQQLMNASAAGRTALLRQNCRSDTSLASDQPSITPGARHGAALGTKMGQHTSRRCGQVREKKQARQQGAMAAPAGHSTGRGRHSALCAAHDRSAHNYALALLSHHHVWLVCWGLRAGCCCCGSCSGSGCCLL